MEPFRKRQRICSPLGREFPQSFEEQHGYYEETSGTELLDDEEEEDEDEETIEEEEPVKELSAKEKEALGDYNFLQQRRAQLDHRLKSTFESIFEKYGRDFDGVGDEIDLATGEIVVNNGHLIQMQNEKDAGEVAASDITDSMDDIPNSSFEGTDAMENDELGLLSDYDENMEDDMILRGFARANRFLQGPPEIDDANKAPPPRERRVEAHSRPVPQKKTLPSRSEILAQFGTQLGSEIVNILSEKQAPSRSYVEPAWDFPELPSSSPAKQTAKVPITLLPEIERSLSPEALPSVWALPQRRGRKKKDMGVGVASRAQNTLVGSHRHSFSQDHFDHQVIHGFGQPEYSPTKRKRKTFTAEDDQILLQWVARAQRRGLALSISFWRDLHAKNPGHSASSWKARYKLKYTYLQEEDVDESGSDTSMDSNLYPNGGPQAANRQDNPPPVSNDRPARVRKPAQKDSRIITWSEAVDAIESLDPDLHAGILEDARMNNFDDWSLGRPTSSTAYNLPLNQPRRASAQVQVVRRSPDARQAVFDYPQSSDSMAAHATPEADSHLIPGAPCPHADCVAFPMTTYKLQRRDGEDLSEMCLHLFQKHHTTPFPCGEINCPRKGEEGYFMQADLVKHVRSAHPHLSALHRLRGRVDRELLARHIDLASSPEIVIATSARPVSGQRDSDFMSASKNNARQIPAIARPVSSSTDMDRTPRGTTEVLGVAPSTPRTSVSSMKVNHSSATKATREASYSVQRSMPSVEDDDQHFYQGNEEDDLVADRSSYAVAAQSDKERSSSQDRATIQVENKVALPTPLPSSRGNPRPTFSFFDKPVNIFTGESVDLEQQTANDEEASINPEASHSITEPSLSKPAAGHENMEQFSERLLSTTTDKLAPQGLNKGMGRNTIDPSYEFSDEEGGFEVTSRLPTLPTITIPSQDMPPPPANKPVHPPATPVVPPAKNSALSSSIARSAGSRPATATSSTKRRSGVRPIAKQPLVPSAAVKARQTILRAVLDSEDFDELSLGNDDLVLLSSQPRKFPRKDIQQLVKQERHESPRLTELPSTRKRTLSTFRRSVSEDELAVSGPSSSPHQALSSGLKSTIKTEPDESNLPLHPVAVPKRRGRPPKAEISGSSLPVRSTPQPERPRATPTPLLDLTPSRPRNHSNRQKDVTIEDEINDSEADSSSPSASPTQAKSNRQIDRNPQTPVQNGKGKRRPAGDMLKAEKVAVVVKTPGGTFRRCGEGEFMCGRSFCFRCGESAVSGVGDEEGHR